MGRFRNPDFPEPPAGLDAEWTRMRASPRRLERPLVVIGGWRAPPFPILVMKRRLRKLVGAPLADTIAISFTTSSTFEQSIRRTLARVQRFWPSQDPGQTAEVDVVAVSMGGLVARAAAMPAAAGEPGNRGRLRIRRLFTLGTPHRGAALARRIAVDSSARDMRAGCEFLRRLNEAERSYELICYARLRDWWVGATNTAPPGSEPIWIDSAGALLSHQTITMDRMILTDIARRLRGEPPLGRPSRPPRD